MRLGDGVEWALHCCALLALVGDRPLSAARLAEFHDVPPAYLAKHLQDLARAGVVEAVAGRRGGYPLARPPAEISLLEIVEATEGRERAFRCSEIRQRGPAAVAPANYSPVCAIAGAMWQAEAAWRRELSSRSIADIVTAVAGEATPESAMKAARWFQEVLA